MKLKVKDVTPYLQYKVWLTYKDCLEGVKRKAQLTGVTTKEIETTYKRKIKGCKGDLIGWTGHNNVSDLEVKLLLRPLSDLTKEIEHNGEKFVPCEFFVISVENMLKKSDVDLDCIPYNVIKKLLEWNFDIFGLIPHGLAIDINTLKI